QQQQL
ncbi:hypothetical protein ACTFIU_011259, partial [Dictyostelium citrinum]